jgi:hypothetical protein
MAETLNKNLQQQRREITDDSDSQLPSRICTICGHEQGYQDHFKPSPHYHVFAAPKTAQSAAGN